VAQGLSLREERARNKGLGEAASRRKNRVYLLLFLGAGEGKAVGGAIGERQEAY